MSSDISRDIEDAISVWKESGRLPNTEVWLPMRKKPSKADDRPPNLEQSGDINEK